MKNKTIVSVLLLLFAGLLLFSCSKKTNGQVQTNQETESISVQKEALESVTEMSENERSNFEKRLEAKVEETMKNFPPAIEMTFEYSFEPIFNYDLKLVKFLLNEENRIDCFYDGILLCTVDCIDGMSGRLYNNCVPRENGFAYSAGFEVSFEDINYYGLINLESGVLKIYKSLQYAHQATPPFYSGNSKYFVIENIGVVSPSYFDTKTFKDVKEQYGGFLEVYNFETSELVYKIDRKLLHKTMSLSIEEIEYVDDSFHIKISQYYDSDEFVDFKLFAENDEFRYEILDSFSYEN